MITFSGAPEAGQSDDQLLSSFPSHLCSRLRLLLEDVQSFRLHAELPAETHHVVPNQASTIQNLWAELENRSRVWEAYDKSGRLEKLRQSANWPKNPEESQGAKDLVGEEVSASFSGLANVTK